jgi:DedD protein
MAKASPSSVRNPDADSDSAALDPSSPAKRRARHRLIGAMALSLVAAVIVPMLLSPEPTRGGSDAAIIVQGRELPPPAATAPTQAPALVSPGSARDTSSPSETASTLKPTATPAARDSAAQLEPDRGAGSLAPAPADGPMRLEAPRAELRPESKPESRPVAKPEPRPEAKSEAKAEAKTEAKAEAKTEAKAESKSRDARADAPGKFLVQVGTFSQTASAQTALDRVKSAGMKGYSETIRTERGERIRVRVGPFNTREAAEQARARLKTAGLEAVIVSPQ